MSMSNRSMRSRVAILAASLALSLSLLAAPAAVAQYDSPEAAVQGLLDDIGAANFEAIAGWFCEDFADQAAMLDMSQLSEGLPPDVDPATVLDAFRFDVMVESIETVSQSDTEALVRVVATLAMNVDVPALEPLIVAILEMSGQEVTPDMIDMVSGMMASEIAGETLDISEEIVVVPNEDGTWGKICSELGGGDEEATDAEAVTDAEVAPIEE